MSPSARQYYAAIASKVTLFDGFIVTLRSTVELDEYKQQLTTRRECAVSSPYVDPILDDITPDHGDASGGQKVLIQGHGLSGSQSVIFGKLKVPADKPTKTTVECVTPEHDEGPVRVYVVLEDSTPSNKLTYMFLDYRS